MRLAPMCFLTAAALSHCKVADTTAPRTIAGTYQATVFHVTPTGQNVLDFVAGGATLTMTITSSDTTTGALHVPASLNSGTAFDRDMAGTVTVTGSSVRFNQQADSFVRDLNWAWNGTTIGVTSQSVGGVSFTITLTKQ
jgi:hypothetical protein